MNGEQIAFRKQEKVRLAGMCVHSFVLPICETTLQFEFSVGGREVIEKTTCYLCNKLLRKR